MESLRGMLYFALVSMSGLFSAWTIRAGRRQWQREGIEEEARPAHPAVLLGIGFVTDFFDTLGIGSFAPTTSLFRLTRAIPDRLIPGTMNIGHAVPTIVEALIYITVVEVDSLTLVLLIAASTAGAWLGAGVVAGLPRRAIQAGMGMAMLVAAGVMLSRLLHLWPAGGNLVALSGRWLAVGLVGNFILGALMTLGIGSYAPSLILFGLLGMNVKAIFPIMMGSCAFIMLAGGVQFVRKQSYSPRAALALTVGGVPAVLLAAFVVRELPLQTLSWLVLVVVVYTAVAMLRSAVAETGPPARRNR